MRTLVHERERLSSGADVALTGSHRWKFFRSENRKTPLAICPSGAKTKWAIFQKWLSYITFRREMGEDRAGNSFPDTQLLSGQTIAAFGREKSDGISSDRPDKRLAVEFT